VSGGHSGEPKEEGGGEFEKDVGEKKITQWGGPVQPNWLEKSRMVGKSVGAQPKRGRMQEGKKLATKVVADQGGSSPGI